MSESSPFFSLWMESVVWGVGFAQSRWYVD